MTDNLENKVVPEADAQAPEIEKTHAPEAASDLIDAVEGAAAGEPSVDAPAEPVAAPVEEAAAAAQDAGNPAPTRLEQLQQIKADMPRKEELQKELEARRRRLTRRADRTRREPAPAAEGEDTASLDERIHKMEQDLDELKIRQEKTGIRRVQLPNKEELQKGLQAKKEALVRRPAEMSAHLKQMLQDEIDAMNKREKRRSAEILAVFAQHNFYANGFTPVELRTTLEDLGPTYVKIGQIMSSRVDLLPVSYCKELEKLRQNVKQLDPEIARAVIEQETGKAIDEIYSEFRDKPLGSASIGQAHYGVLKDGTRVVTKVQRPLIADMMRKDFVLLKRLAGLVSVVTESDDGEEMVDLVSVIEELEKVTEEELDFRIEAENTRFFKENCIEDETKITCPTVIDELTTERIFTMTYVDGYSISKMDKLLADGCDPDALGNAILENYVHQILDVGTFHGDPHQGNIMVSHGVPYWIDFGMIGRITEADVNVIQSLILALLENDLEAMVNAVISLGAASPQTDRNKLMEDLDGLLSKYMTISSANDLDLAVLLEEITDLAGKHHISLPGKYTMLVRSIATIEGVIAQLCPTINLFAILSAKLMDRARQSFDVRQSLLSAGKDVLEVGKKTSRIPMLAYDAMNNMVKGRMKMNLELTGYEELVKQISGGAKNIVLALFACILFLGSAILCTADISPKTAQGVPLAGAAGLILAIALGIYTVRQMSKKK